MFGKTKETSHVDDRPEGDVRIDDFFGDESAVAEAVRVDHLHQRVTQVELQISSQFTSLAAYAQIAQEQVELVRSEAQNSSERSEQRVIGLIERERADRMNSGSDGTTGVSARLDALDAQVGEIRVGLQQCLSNQKALADAITDLFAPAVDAPPPPGPMATAPTTDTMMSTAMPAPLTAAPTSPTPIDAPPPPAAVSTFEDLDAHLEELGVDIMIDSSFEDVDVADGEDVADGADVADVADLGVDVIVDDELDDDLELDLVDEADLDGALPVDEADLADEFVEIKAFNIFDESIDGPIDGLSLA